MVLTGFQVLCYLPYFFPFSPPLRERGNPITSKSWKRQELAQGLKALGSDKVWTPESMLLTLYGVPFHPHSHPAPGDQTDWAVIPIQGPYMSKWSLLIYTRKNHNIRLFKKLCLKDCLMDKLSNLPALHTCLLGKERMEGILELGIRKWEKRLESHS